MPIGKWGQDTFDPALSSLIEISLIQDVLE